MKSVMVSIPTNFWRLLSHSGAARTPAIANQSISRLKIISGMGWAAAYRCERAQRRLSWRAAECRRRLTLHWSVWDRNTCGTWRTWQIFDSRHLLSRYKIEKHFNSTNSIQAKQKWKRAQSKYWYRKWGIVGSFCDWMTQKKLIPKSNFQAIGQRDHKKNRSYFFCDYKSYKMHIDVRVWRSDLHFFGERRYLPGGPHVVIKSLQLKWSMLPNSSISSSRYSFSSLSARKVT